MQTERFVEPAKNWLEKRPTLTEQLSSPAFSLKRAKDEIDETLVEVEKIPLIGDEITFEELRELIKKEWVDVMNFIACAEFALVQMFDFTEEELLDYSHFVYGIRNHHKYPVENYQNGTPPHEQLRADANMWSFYQAYLGIAEVGLGGEYY